MKHPRGNKDTSFGRESNTRRRKTFESPDITCTKTQTCSLIVLKVVLTIDKNPKVDESRELYKRYLRIMFGRVIHLINIKNLDFD